MKYLKKLENLLEKLVLLADFGINATNEEPRDTLRHPLPTCRELSFSLTTV